MGVSADHPATLEAFTKQNNVRHLLLGDFRRAMLPAYGAMQTDEASPVFRYARRAYFIIGRDGTVKYVKIQQNALELLDPDEVLAALEAAG